MHARTPSVGGELIHQLVGSWRLLSFVAHHEDGRDTEDYGDKPLGCLLYDERGRMSVHIANSHGIALSSGDLLRVVTEEPQRAYDAYFGYFGTCTVDESAGTVTHLIEGASHSGYAGTSQQRFYTLQGDHLVLRTQPEHASGAEVVYVAKWERYR